MKQNQWSVIVGNIGTVWNGTNGAQAMREFGQWRTSSVNDETRGAGEPVTLMRNDNPEREYPGHVWFLYRLGDGNEGNFPRFYVRVQNDVNPYAYLAACVANRYIAGSSTRRYIVKNTEVDGEFDYGLNATVYEGPKGEQSFGAAWITAEFEPAELSDMARNNRPQFVNPTDHLDRGAMRIIRGQK